MSDSVQPHRRQPTRLPLPWDSPGKNTGVGCHFLLQCTKVKSESEVTQSCPTLCDPMDCSLPGSSIHGIFQARVLEWGAIAFSVSRPYLDSIPATQIIKDLSEGPCTSSPPCPGRSFCWSSLLLSWPTSAPNSNLRSNICPFSWANYMPSAPPPLEPGLESGATKPVAVLRKSECHSSRITCPHNMRIFL